MKKLSVIIVNYNVCYFLEQAIKSVINASKNLDVEILVVDNNSVDKSVELVQSKFPEITLIANKENVGFSKANNQAMRIAKGEYVLLLNPDTLLEEDTLEKCCVFMDQHPNAGALGVKMVDGKGNFLPESKRGLPTPEVAFFKMFGLSSVFPKSKWFGKYHLGYLAEDETNEVEVLSGAYMFMRKEALDKVGLLDEEYFMYGEDIDLSYRIIKGGFKNYYYPETRIIHYKGESTKKTSINYVFVFYKAMVIFARKHFSENKANLFSFLINIAIYLKAGIDLLIGFIRSASMTVLDASLIYVGMHFMKDYWESNHKYAPTKYPPEFINIVVPAYIGVWLVTNYFSGGNDKPIRVSKIVRGAIVGTVLISAFTNFFDDYRFSKALILIGGVVSTLVFIFTRLMSHFIRNNNFTLGVEKEKRIALVGNLNESERVMGLLREMNASVHVVGFIAPEKNGLKDENLLGGIDQLSEIIEIYKLDELIFCSKDISANEIIERMINIDKKFLDFKIVPDESNYIIGSNSKNRPGDFYTVEIKLNIIERHNIRNKRVFDVVASVLQFLLYPLFFLLVKKKWSYTKNLFKVLFGKKSWVGFTDYSHVHLPTIKRGVLTTTTNILADHLDELSVKRLDTIYAKEYSVSADLEILLKSIPRLGN